MLVTLAHHHYMGKYIDADPYKWPYNGDLTPSNTCLLVIDMQVDFCAKGKDNTYQAGRHCRHASGQYSLVRISVDIFPHVIMMCQSNERDGWWKLRVLCDLENCITTSEKPHWTKRFLSWGENRYKTINFKSTIHFWHSILRTTTRRINRKHQILNRTLNTLSKMRVKISAIRVWLVQCGLAH